MDTRKITLVAAMAENRVIGANGDIPWMGKIPRDLAHFRDVTRGQTVVMGQKTWESLPESSRPLPGRTNIVLSLDPSFAPSGATIAHDTEEALALAGDRDLIVMGGGQVYRLFLPHATHLELTIVGGSFEGDTFFPEFDEADWRETARVVHAPDDANAYPLTFRSLIRRSIEES